MIISVYLDDVRRADVVVTSANPSVVLRGGAFSRVSIVTKSEEQARVIAEAINASVDPHAPLYDKRPGGA